MPDFKNLAYLSRAAGLHPAAFFYYLVYLFFFGNFPDDFTEFVNFTEN